MWKSTHLRQVVKIFHGISRDVNEEIFTTAKVIIHCNCTTDKYFIKLAIPRSVKELKMKVYLIKAKVQFKIVVVIRSFFVYLATALSLTLNSLCKYIMASRRSGKKLKLFLDCCGAPMHSILTVI